MKNIYIIVFLTVTGFTAQLSAQDIHFSQFYMSPLNLNPALTGVNNCKTRLIANYRNQWASVLGSNAYNTYSVSFDQKVAVGRSDYFGIGGTIWGDSAGESRFGSTQGKVSFSYSKQVSGYRKSAKYLVVGADAGFTQRKVRSGDLRWGTQHDGAGGFDATLPTGEVINDFDFIYADLSVGILFFNVTDERNNWYVGASIAHLNQPNVSFLADDSITLFTRNTFHAGAEIEIAKKMSILPAAVLFFQGQQREYNIGSSLRFDMGSRTVQQSWQVGAWFRAGTQQNDRDANGEITTSGGGLHADAFILSTRFNYDQFGIGFSYDSTLSNLQQGGNAVGSFEFSLNYFICGPEKRGVYCPRF